MNPDPIAQVQQEVSELHTPEHAALATITAQQETIRQLVQALERIMQADPYNMAMHDDGMPGSDYKAETWHVAQAALDAVKRQAEG